jgi:hypothetical protein
MLVSLGGCDVSSSPKPPPTARPPAIPTAFPTLSSRALGLQDLPSGFEQLHVVNWADAAMAARTHLRRSDYDRHGYIMAHEVVYRRLTLHGLAVVSNIVYQYKQQWGARWQLAELTRSDSQRHYTSVLFRHIGEQSQGFVFHPHLNGLAGTEYVVLFRRGTFVVGVLGAGKAGTVTSRQVSNLARIVDYRLQHAS